MSKEEQIREGLLVKLSQDRAVIKTLLNYTENKFISGRTAFKNQMIPMTDEPFVSSWRSYAAAAESEELFTVLKTRIVQFQFPIKQNISQTDAYKTATLKGQDVKDLSNGLSLKDESSLTLAIYEGLAGGMPVLSVDNIADFYSVVQALCLKNEPVALPLSMGAVMIQGLNNWDRLHAYRKNWSLKNPFADWNAEFIKQVLPDKTIYQDKIIVLSRQGYSNMSGRDLGIEQKKWLDISSEIRLYHEYAHYFTLRYFGHMANNMHDELVADYAGINKVLGKFRASWFLYFIGLQDYPNYRQGGRLENYIHKDQYSAEAFTVLCTIVYQAAINVERFDEFAGSCKSDQDRSIRLLCLCQVGLLYLSGPDGWSRLASAYAVLQQTSTTVNKRTDDY